MPSLIRHFAVLLAPAALFAGFDWGGNTCDGSGSFEQQIPHQSVVTVGEIPVGKTGVSIALRSDEDVDIQLYDKATGDPLVQWPDGALNGANVASTTYDGLTITYSGYNGDGTGLGHEYIRLTGTTNRTLVMKAFGYAAGYATVDYAWTGTQGCSDGPAASGSGSFDQYIQQNAVVTVGDLISGLSDVSVSLTSDEDVDIQLVDLSNGTKVVQWPDGLLSGATRGSVSYGGLTIEYSGYNGDGSGLGHEYIRITGTLDRTYRLSAFGYAAGNARVDYAWGGREQTVVAAITAKNGDLSAADRQMKYCKMNDSLFGFYRGTNHLYWMDMASDARLATYGGRSSTLTWLQGDLHTENYGAFDNDDGTIVYDLNDFDDSLIADYQYDLWRMATALILMMEANGFDVEDDQDTVIDAFVEYYLDTLASDAADDGEISRRYTEANTYGRLNDFLHDDVSADLGRNVMLEEWTVVTGSGRAFKLAHEDLESTGSVESDIRSHYASYVSTTTINDADYFAIKDIAKRINAGTGSLGTPRYYILIEGATSLDSDDVILDMKREDQPTGYGYLGSAERQRIDSVCADSACLAAAAYKSLQNDVDDHLGWVVMGDGAYLVRERSPYKKTFKTARLDSMTRLTKMAEQWGAILATDHARADRDSETSTLSNDFDSSVAAITDSSHSDFRALVREVAHEYAARAAEDYGYFQANFSFGSCP